MSAAGRDAAGWSLAVPPLNCALRECPRQDSNLRTRLRRAVLYPLSYGGARRNSTAPGGAPAHIAGRSRGSGSRLRGVANGLQSNADGPTVAVNDT
jgi:hypothetical protein